MLYVAYSLCCFPKKIRTELKKKKCHYARKHEPKEMYSFLSKSSFYFRIINHLNVPKPSAIIAIKIQMKKKRKFFVLGFYLFFFLDEMFSNICTVPLHFSVECLSNTRN